MHLYLQMIDEFTDVNGGEKELMKLWNDFSMENKSASINYDNNYRCLAVTLWLPAHRGTSLPWTVRVGWWAEFFFLHNSNAMPIPGIQ
jgi:hypothetical protein